jgi:hypothetical protein
MYLPVRKDNPQRSSIDLAKGIKYVEATKPIKSFEISSSFLVLALFKKELTDANNNKSPIRF